MMFLAVLALSYLALGVPGVIIVLIGAGIAGCL
jgi:hypothetical protein